jgi:hypothetical protein
MSAGSRLAFAAWKLYRTSPLARTFLDPMIRRSAETGLARHDEFVRDVEPSERWGQGTRDEKRLRAFLGHLGARETPPVVFADAVEGPTLEELRAGGHAITRRVFGEPPLAGLRAKVEGSRVTLDARLLSPFFVTSPWGSVVLDAFDLALGRKDWRDPLPPLVSARIDDVSGEHGLGWLRPFEEKGIRPSIGTLHDRWLAGPSVKALVEAATRGSSISPHAFDMDRFIWFDAHAARPFPRERMTLHRDKIERDCKETGLVLGKTLNAHFDVVGETALEAAKALGFEYVLGEHEIGQDWRSHPRARDPLGTPLYCYGPAGPLVGFQAEGAIASSASPRSRYDWLRNFVEVDRRTNLPVKEGLDRKGAVQQGVTQLLSALYAGFPAYLLAHEVQLDALGPETLGELLGDVLREVKERVPEIRLASFDELPAACAKRLATLNGPRTDRPRGTS